VTADQANAAVTEALERAQSAVTGAIEAYRDVLEAEVVLSRIAETAEERALAERGVGTTRVMLAVLRALG